MPNEPNQTPGQGPIEDPNVSVVVIDEHQVRWAAEIEDWDAATLLACVSEDPADWSEIAAVWRRYQTGPSAEFADALPLSVGDLDTLLPQLRPGEPWLVLDLKEKRVFSSAGYDEVQRDGCFGLGPEDGFGPAIRLPVHLPPWWLIHNDARPQDVSQPRASQLCWPAPRRDVLWGPAHAEALAGGMLAVYGGREWNRAGASADRRARYPFTVQIHRDWLMTPRSDLGGRIPRDSLHGGMDWIDRVIEAQTWNITSGQAPVPIPRDLSSYADAPMGRAEVCLYFDLCREMIEGGWQWLVDHDDEIASVDSRGASAAGFDKADVALAKVLNQIRDEWLRSPHEDGGPPSMIIQNERDRIPEVVGAGDDGHVVDCDCPICQMMADGMFGPGFVGFDGHHLELDDEFAFSLCETRQEWELQQQEYAEMSASIDAEIEREKKQRTESTSELDPVWQTSFVADEGLPGDSSGHLALGFRLAEIISELQGRSGTRADIDTLNQAFSAYRHAEPADPSQRQAATERFKDALEQTAQRHEFLITRAADLQSRLDELLRRPAQADRGDEMHW